MDPQSQKETPAGTFSFQSSLPRLPVPDLDQSCEKLLKTLKPLAQSEEEYQRLVKDVEDFGKEGGVGRFLQSKLIEHDRQMGKLPKPKSWIDDWWLNIAYLSSRTPLPIYTSVHLAVSNNYQVNRETRASRFVLYMIKYHLLIQKEELPPQRIPRLGNIPLCMEQYKRIFSVARIPKKGLDQLVKFENSEHIVVVTKDHFFKVNVFKNGTHISEQELKREFKMILEESEKMGSGPKISLLTSQNRDIWSEQREKLINLSQRNSNSIQAIESSLFVVSFPDNFPSDKTELAEACMHGDDGSNRWIDKSLNCFFWKNGKVGGLGEHTPWEATQPMQMFDWVLKREAVDSYKNFDLTPFSDSSSPSSNSLNDDNLSILTQKLKWDLNKEIEEGIETARQNFQKILQDVDLKIFQFLEYGQQWIKKVAKISPDSWIQMAIQISYYRLNGKVVPTYESASTRQFLNGRTETCRPISEKSLELCKIFDDKSISKQQKRDSLKQASSSHVEYMMDCFNGVGWDRHFFGLRVLASTLDPNSFPQPKLFSNDIFKRSNQFTLSTSNISPGKMFYGGFGIIDPNGYGVCYLVESDWIWFNVSTSHSSPITNSRKFKNVLISTLFDLKDLFESNI